MTHNTDHYITESRQTRQSIAQRCTTICECLVQIINLTSVRLSDSKKKMA